MTDDYTAKERYQSTAVADQYDNERFSTWHGRLSHKAEASALKTMAERYFESAGTVLEVPCGTARLFPVLAALGLRVTGADVSNEMLDAARKKYGDDPGVSFQRADAENMPFGDDSFDYATSFRLMCHLPPETRRTVLREMLRVTKKILIVNYHFTSLAPLYLFNQVFRRRYLSPYPHREAELREDLEQEKGAKLLEIRKLSWYERSSALVVIQKARSHATDHLP